MYIPTDKIQTLHYYYWAKTCLQWSYYTSYHNNYKFFYLNSIEEYNNLREAYHLTTSFNSVFIPSTVDFPRYKLQMANIKRKLTVESADAIVYDDRDLNSIYNYEGDFENVVIYSKETDTYYVINTCPNSDRNDELDKILKNLNLQDADPVDKVMALLKYNKLLPDDYTIIYTGPICAIIQPITSKYITTDDLDELISTNLPIPTKNDLDSIDQMLKSNDDATVSMGLKCLCGYNIYFCKIRVATILYKNWSHIQYNKARSSVGVKNLFNSLNFSKDLYDLPTVYTRVVQSGVTDDDYNKAREYIISLLKSQYARRINGDEACYDTFNIKININFE